MLSSVDKWRIVCAISALRFGRSVFPQRSPFYYNLPFFGLSYKKLYK